MINIVVTSKPVDGLLYYSYEYCSYLNSIDVNAQVIIVRHRKFPKEEYIKTIQNKYIHCQRVVFDSFTPNADDVTLVMGRSMITLSWINYNDYTEEQKQTLHNVFKDNIISVYSENHPVQYPQALKFYNPKQIVDLCDKEVYPNGVGEHFEKTINFSIYKPHTDNVQFKHLFLGTNDKYYASAEKLLDQYSDHGILTYNENYVNIKNNNVFAPVKNLMGIFDTYVYTKETFDPAPRIIQECKYYGRDIIYARDKDIVDGGSVYFQRDIKEPDITPILDAYEKFNL